MSSGWKLIGWYFVYVSRSSSWPLQDGHMACNLILEVVVSKNRGRLQKDHYFPRELSK